MVMHMSVDDRQVVPTLNTMKKELRDLNATWRANVEAAKAAGDNLEATKAKAEGLARASEKQNQILEFGNGVLKNTTEVTKDNRNEYDRLVSEMEKADAQYKNITSQLQVALTAFERQETGIDELNKTIHANDELTQSQIKTLKQQGDEYGANELKVKSLEDKKKSLQDVAVKEEEILKKVADRTGEGSRAYTEQATTLQNAKNKVVDVNTEMQRYSERLDINNVKLGNLKKIYSENKEQQDSYITRLKAEGKQAEANVLDVNKLRESYKNLNEQYKIQVDKMDGALAGSDKFKSLYVEANKTATEMARVSDQAKKTQIEVNKMSPFGLSSIGKAFNNTGNAAKLMGDKTVNAYQYIRRNAALVTIAVGGVGALIGKGVKEMADLQDSYLKTSNMLITGGEKQAEVTKNVSQMQKDGRALSIEYGKSQQEIADGYLELVKRGYTSTQALGAMRTELQASVSTGDDFNSVVSVSSQVLDAYGLRVDNVTQMQENTKKVVNQLSYAADLTATDFHSMGKAMEYVGDTAASAKIPLEEASTSVGILSNHGLEADKAGTGLRKVINSLTQALGDQISAQDKSAEGQAKMNQKIEEQKQKVQEAQDAVNKATEAEKTNTKGKKNFKKAVESSNKQLKKQQDNLDKLEGKAQAAAGAQDMLSSLGISRDQLVQSNGQLKSMDEIMRVLNEKTKGITDVDVKNNIFHALFGTTGMQAGIILAQNNGEIKKLTENVKKSADGQGYVATLAEKNMQSTKQQMNQLNSVAQDITMTLGAAMLPAINDAAKAMKKAFDSDGGQKFLKGVADWVGKIAQMLVDMAKWIGEHWDLFKNFAKLMIGIFAINKISKFVGFLRNTIDLFKEMKKAAMEFKAVDAFSGMGGAGGGVGGAAKMGKVAQGAEVAGELGASAIGSRAAGAGGAYQSLGSKAGAAMTTGKLGSFLGGTKAVAGVAAKYASVFGAAFTAVDLGGSVVKALNSDSAKDKYKAGAQGAGTAIGGTIGGILGSIIPGAGTVVGAGLGATIGNELGKADWASSAAEKISKALGKAFEEHPVEPKKVTEKSAKKELSEQYEEYYKEKAKADQKDIDLLHKNGMISDEEYSRRTDEIKKEAEKANDFTKMSEEDRTNIVKYYEIQRKDLEQAFSKEKKSVRDKWDKQITQDAVKYGENSVEVRKDYEKKNKAIDDLEKKRKDEVNKLSIESVSKTTAEEARLHVTAAGKADFANQNLIKSKQNLVREMSKLSEKQKQAVVNNAQEEYERVKYYSNKAYEESKKAADKKFKENTKAADNQSNSVKEAAEKERDAVIAAGNKQFQGTSKSAVDQRKAVVDQANQTYEQKVKAASDTHQEVYDKAEQERKDTLKAAQQKRDDNIKQAEQEKNSISAAAGKQAENVKKSSDDTHKHVKNSSADFWGDFIKSVGQGLGLSASTINAALKGINWVLHQFGGGKETIPLMQEKYATGTGMFSNARRPITKPTFALLNDGYDSPETGNRETLVHPNGNMEIVEGNNVSRWLAPGTEVLNAKETAMMMGATPFADGTGFLGKLWGGIKGAGSAIGKFAGDTWSNMAGGIEKFTKMFSYITNAVAHPVETLSEQFTQKREGDKGSVFNTIMDGSLSKTKDQAKDWWTELWGMANESASAGDVGSQGDNYPWKNSGKDSAADPWGYFLRECVSYVANSLKNMGVNPSLFSGLGNGSDWVNAPVRHTNDPKPGMVAVYGAGSEFGNHVAMVRGVKGDTFSGEEYNWGGDGNYHTYSGRRKSGVTTFLDFGKTGDSAKGVESKNPLQKLIKSQVGGMFDWIQKFISPINDTSTGVGGDVQSWSNDVKKALSKLGLSTSPSMIQKILRQIQTESGGNQRAIGGNDGLADGNATGLMQVKPGTFRAYALPGHSNIMNGYDNMLAGLNYAKDRYGSDLGFLGNGHGYANGGIITKHQIAQLGEGNQPEVVIPFDKMKSSRGFELLGQTVTAFAARDGLTGQETSNIGSDDKLDKIVILLSQILEGQANEKLVMATSQVAGELNRFRASQNSFDTLSMGIV